MNQFSSYREALNHYLSLSPGERESTDFTSELIWSLAHIPKIYQLLDIEKDWYGDEAAKKLVKLYLENLEDNIKNGIGIYFYGKHGTGKTFLSCFLLREAIRSFDYRYPPLFHGAFITFSDLLFSFSDSFFFKEQYQEKLQKVDLLVIDDIGKKEKNSDLIIDSLLRNRLYSKKPIIMTSSVFPEEFSSSWGEGIFSLLHERVIRIKVQGEDFRKKMEK